MSPKILLKVLLFIGLGQCLQAQSDSGSSEDSNNQFNNITTTDLTKIVSTHPITNGVRWIWNLMSSKFSNFFTIMLGRVFKVELHPQALLEETRGRPQPYEYPIAANSSKIVDTNETTTLLKDFQSKQDSIEFSSTTPPSQNILENIEGKQSRDDLGRKMTQFSEKTPLTEKKLENKENENKASTKSPLPEKINKSFENKQDKKMASPTTTPPPPPPPPPQKLFEDYGEDSLNAIYSESVSESNESNESSDNHKRKKRSSRVRRKIIWDAEEDGEYMVKSKIKEANKEYYELKKNYRKKPKKPSKSKTDDLGGDESAIEGEEPMEGEDGNAIGEDGAPVIDEGGMEDENPEKSAGDEPQEGDEAGLEPNEPLGEDEPPPEGEGADARDTADPEESPAEEAGAPTTEDAGEPPAEKPAEDKEPAAAEDREPPTTEGDEAAATEGEEPPAAEGEEPPAAEGEEPVEGEEPAAEESKRKRRSITHRAKRGVQPTNRKYDRTNKKQRPTAHTGRHINSGSDRNQPKGEKKGRTINGESSRNKLPRGKQGRGIYGGGSQNKLPRDSSKKYEGRSGSGSSYPVGNRRPRGKRPQIGKYDRKKRPTRPTPYDYEGREGEGIPTNNFKYSRKYRKERPIGFEERGGGGYQVPRRKSGSRNPPELWKPGSNRDRPDPYEERSGGGYDVSNGRPELWKPDRKGRPRRPTPYDDDYDTEGRSSDWNDLKYRRKEQKEIPNGYGDLKYTFPKGKYDAWFQQP